MSRLNIEIPVNELSHVRIPVRISDINYGNHLGNDAIVSIIHEARVQFLQSHSFTELDAGGISLIMKDLQVNYLNESFYGDMLEVVIGCNEISAVSFQLVYRVLTHRHEKVIDIAHASTQLVGYNYNTRRLTKLPDALVSILKTN